MTNSSNDIPFHVECDYVEGKRDSFLGESSNNTNKMRSAYPFNVERL